MKAIIAVLVLSACGKDVETPDDPSHEEELITTVELTFTPVGGGSAVVARFVDLQDGSPSTDDIALADEVDYALAVAFLNELEDPAEDITAEVRDEGDEHQVFFTGSAIGDVITHSYDDADADGLPIGLEGTVTTVAPGAGALVVTLRHLPPENEVAAKEAGLAEQAASDGTASLPGDTDVEVAFDLTVE